MKKLMLYTCNNNKKNLASFDSTFRKIMYKEKRKKKCK